MHTTKKRLNLCSRKDGNSCSTSDTWSVIIEEMSWFWLRQTEHGHFLTSWLSKSSRPFFFGVTLSLGTLGSVASLLAATLYQGNHDKNHKLWNINFKDGYFIGRCCWNVVTYKWKVHNGKIEIFSHKVSFLTGPSLSISRCILMFEADLAVSFILNLMG